MRLGWLVFRCLVLCAAVLICAQVVWRERSLRALEPKPLVLVVFRSLSQQNGYGMWTHRMMGTLKAMNRSVEECWLGNEAEGGDAPCRLDLMQTSLTVVQDVSVFDARSFRFLKALCALASWERVFFGLFILDRKNKRICSDATLESRSINVLCESETQKKRCDDLKVFFSHPLVCHVAPPGIELPDRSALKARKDRPIPLVYLKYHDQRGPNYQFLPDSTLQRVLKSVPSLFSAHVVLRTSHFKAGPYAALHYTQEQFFTALSNAPYAILYSPSETQGTFFHETRSFDVPVLCVDFVPPNFANSSGMLTTQDKLEQDLLLFLARLPTFTPRADVEEMSFHATAVNLQKIMTV